MSNSYFRFRQFIVHQERCAMKVSTDACIQGAWTPLVSETRRVLDIGAGTGLLSLMIAQRLPEAVIDAIELNADAAAQAAENAAVSPFAARIRVVQAEAVAWQNPDRYDLIICNPPFFKNSLAGPHAARNAARHMDALNAQSLAHLLLSNLSPAGTASVMWPEPEHGHFIKIAADSGIYLRSALQVRDTAGSRITRIIGTYGLHPSAQTVVETLIVKADDGSYTGAFRTLLTPFYLRL